MQKIILTTIALMLLSSVGYGADWKYIFTAPTGGEWFYDTQSVTHGEDTTLVWTKWILSDKERAKFIKEFPKEFKKKVSMDINGREIIRTTNELIEISFFIQKEEINCSKNVARIMSMSLFALGGEVIWSSGDHKQNQFEDVFPDSKGVTLLEAICKEGEGGKKLLRTAETWKKAVTFSEADGFRGIKWGTDISTLNDMQYVTTDPSYGGIKVYLRKNDELKIGGAELESIKYGFWQGKFFNITINTKGFANFASLKEATFEKFGQGDKPNHFMEQYFWTGEITRMMLQYSEVSYEGKLYMFSRELNKQQENSNAENAPKGAETGF